MDEQTSLIDKCKQRMAPYKCEGFLMGKGPRHPLIMFVGEAPGATEIESEEPFSGQAGEYFDQYLAFLGLNRDEVFVTSTVRSRPYQLTRRIGKNGEIRESKRNRPPTQKEIEAHAPLLDWQIEYVNPKIIVTMGNVALHRLVQTRKTITSLHGRMFEVQLRRRENPFQSDEHWGLTSKKWKVFPTFHPAAIIYRPSIKPLVFQDLNKLRGFLTRPNHEKGEDKIMNQWQEITKTEEWEGVKKESYQKPVLILKHSTSCPISAGAFQEFKKFTSSTEGQKVSPVLVKVIESRSVSNLIAEDTGVRHQSPQVIIIKDGQPVWDESHWSVTVSSMEKALSQILSRR